MSGIRGSAEIKNGNEPYSAVDAEDAADNGEEEDGETKSLLSSALKGGGMKGRKQRSRRKVQWNDRNGKMLVDVIEFQPSDSSDSEDDADSCVCNIM